MDDFKDLNPVTEWDRAKKLLDMNPQNLTGLEKQRRYILELHLRRMPCPVCHHMQNIYEAADGTKTVGDLYEGEYVCGGDQEDVGCGVILVEVVPFFAGATPWHWARKHPPTKEERAKLKEMHKR